MDIELPDRAHLFSATNGASMPADPASVRRGDLEGRNEIGQVTDWGHTDLNSGYAGLDADEILYHGVFLAQLRREQRRADRSEAPLALAVFKLGAEADATERERLKKLLLGSKRETDILGEVGSGFAVICPDTGTAGIERFIAKVRERCQGVAFNTEASVYPDDLFARLAAKQPLASTLAAELEGSDDAGEASGDYPLKRALDIIGAVVALIVFSPVMIATAIAVRLSSPGPIIFKQTRIGQRGRSFDFYKFRSMKVNGDDRIHREYVANLIKGENDKVNQQNASQPLYKLKSDPRITSVGRFIRKTSIDELPQLVNVLKGDLSLVGPRPPLPYEAEAYRSWHLRRVLDAKPGITGLWQVEGRSRVTFDEMVRMDLRYVNRCCLQLDLRILLQTVRVVFMGAGGG